MERTPFTKEGFERLKKELETLEKVERFKAIKAIAVARAHGYLS
jgi:transcription elongation factor GreA